MANKNYRVIARKTVYYYLDVVVNKKDDAITQGWETPENEFNLKPDPQNEWKVLDAVLMDTNGKVDDLKYLTKT